MLPPHSSFVALDFETADHGPDSACAIGVVRVEGGKVVHKEGILLRPPRQRILFTHVHGITWPMVATASTFAEVWPRLVPMLEGAAFIAAHNSSFDKKVLRACCEVAGHAFPEVPFVCTVQVARKKWGLKPNDLASVCRRLGIGLIHHNALSDAEACARIVIAAGATQ